MRNVALVRRVTRVRDLIARIGPACGQDMELQAQWAQYICVLVAGLVENAVKDIYGNYTASRSAKTVSNYVSGQLKQIRNPKSGRLLEIAGSFDPEWVDALKKYLDQDGRGDAIDSIMNNRHSIAHGGSSSITIARVREYFAKATGVIEYIEEQAM